VTGFQGLPSGAVDYESALERDFVLLTRFDDPAVRIRSQPITLNFEARLAVGRDIADVLQLPSYGWPSLDQVTAA
jgi:hypothetical protein